MCPWSDVIPEDVEAPLPRVALGALCESLCALFELSQALCFLVIYTGPDSCASATSTCPLLAFFFFFAGLSSSFLLFLFVRSLCCPRRVPLYLPSFHVDT